VRIVGGCMIALHVAAILVANIPLDAAPGRSLAIAWLRASRSPQSWGMWADPPTEDIYLAARAHSRDGTATELRVDLDPTRDERPAALGYDRRWKIVGRIARTGTGGPYLEAFASWICRNTSESTSIELSTLSSQIPRLGKRRSSEIATRHLATIACPTA